MSQQIICFLHNIEKSRQNFKIKIKLFNSEFGRKDVNQLRGKKN